MLAHRTSRVNVSIKFYELNAIVFDTPTYSPEDNASHRYATLMPMTQDLPISDIIFHKYKF